ncbi:non-ribosomal peptide synthetase [Microbulbifer halophilus]|uniref:Non-ribosomal peptide synthetase n=1 Tax=Microbulbifer halophilus TaxID=453963 RepID=A0ABW5ED14_9GAMM|nr:non-ribosomal peptide synthetase [Microbulbifer halophilus]MCW8128236.1 amino acid adenylation domain-containing protein [Microbulbifer halophilus]
MNQRATTVYELIAVLAARDIKLWLEGESLRFSAPPGVFDDELRADVQRHRDDIVALLREEMAVSTPSEMPTAPALERLPLSASEERLWFLYRHEGPSPAYNVLVTMSLDIPVDISCHRRAIGTLVARHETLRTRFAEEDGVPFRVVDQTSMPVTPLIDLSALADETLAAREVDGLVKREEQRLFALDRDLPLHSCVIRLGVSRHVLMMNVHHIATDAWSSGILAREYMQLMDALQAGREPQLSAPAAGYADFAWWQQKELCDGGFDTQLEFWKNTLRGLPPLLDLPTDNPRPAVKRYEGASVRRMLPAATADALNAFCRRQGATLFMGLLAVFKAMLARCCAMQDIAVGTAVAGRPFPELANVVGMFTNTIVIRTNVDQRQSFSELLGTVRDNTFAAQANQSIPFRTVVEHCIGERDLSYTPLYQVSLALNNAAEREVVQLADTGEQFSDNDGIISNAVKDDLSLQFRRFPEGLEFKLTYDIHLFEPDSAERLTVFYTQLLDQVLAAPEVPLASFGLMDASMRERVLDLGRPSIDRAPEGGALENLFRQRCDTAPDAIAVEHGGLQLSYGALDRVAGSYASRLQSLGVAPLDRVALCVDTAVDLVAGMLAILELGAAYVPLDIKHSSQSIEHVVADTGLRVVLCSASAEAVMPNETTCVRIDLADMKSVPDSVRRHRQAAPTLDGSHPAYVMYTSGSTGAPKGVEVPHRAVVRLVRGSDYVEIGPDDVFMQMSNHAFDAATFEVWGALAGGARLVGVNRDQLLDLEQFPLLLRDHKVSAMFITVALFNLLIELDPQALSEVDTVGFGGDAASPATVRRVLEEGKPPRLLNLYGPTENTTFSTWHEIRTPLDAARCFIGQAISGASAYVVDNEDHLAPLGVCGELLVGGSGVALGYIGQPALTAERFVPDPFSREPGARLYRTGDWVRRGPDGVIEYIGRRDKQVKIRGFRVELGEIEDQITAHSAVGNAAAVVHTDDRGDKRVIAYVASEPVSGLEENLRAFLRERLPEYKHPSHYVFLPELPLTPNGKIDRAHLPAFNQPTGKTGIVPPRDDIERQLALLWGELLGVRDISVTDNFFELGGHSLMAITLSVRVRDLLGVDLSTRDVFEHPDLQGLALHIRERRRGGALTLKPIVRVGKRERSVASYMQQRLWFVEQVQGSTGAYNMPIAMRLQASVSVDTIRRAIARIVERHDVLRTAIVEVNGLPKQRVSAAVEVPLGTVDLGDLPAVDEDRVDEILGEAISRPFDLTTAPLLRALLLRIPGGGVILALTLHHIVCDGWSLGVLMGELSALLQDPEADLAELPVQYGDYAHWLGASLEGEALEARLAFWRESLRGAPPLLELRCAKPRPAERNDVGRTLVAQLDRGLSTQLKALAVRENSSLFMLMLGAFDALLAFHAGHGDIVVGTPVANRPRTELEPLIGFFVNTLPLRVQVSADESFLQLLQRVRKTALAAYDYQDTPLDLIVDDLGLERSLAFQPLVQVMFAQENFVDLSTPAKEIEQISLRDNNRTAKFDLNLSFEDRPDGIRLYCEYSCALFDAATVRELLQQYERFLRRACDGPEQPLRDLQAVDLEAERSSVSLVNQHAEAPRDRRSLALQFGDVVRADPQAIALIGSAGEMTYAQLDDASDRLAARLRQAGVVAEAPVGICMSRSPSLVVAVLAVIKAGGAYVPIEQGAAEDRRKMVIKGASVQTVVVDAATEADFRETQVALVRGDLASGEASAGVHTTDLGPDALAYVIHTSGSTGVPKGVAVTHGGVSRLVRNACYLPFEERLRFILSSSVSFDLATFEIWGALLNGGQLVVIETQPSDPAAFTRALRDYRVSALWLTSALFDIWCRYLDSDLPELRFLLVGGDVISPVSCALAHKKLPGVRLINGYGPTENTTFSTWYDIPRAHPEDRPIPIGGSIPNSSCHVLDDDLRPVPVGAPGILYVGGHGLARGYMGRADMTAELFLPNPCGQTQGARLYCTGDRVILGEDGQLIYLGRRDRQVKIRGFRVEPGEVEAVLRRREEVADAAVLVHFAEGGERQLIAFAVARDPDDDLAGLRDALRSSVPDYMVPASLVTLDTMPINASGKIDRALLETRVTLPQVERAYAEPQTPTEAEIAAIWEEVLSRSRIGRHDNFFDLGGHSLLAAQVCAQVDRQFGIELPVRTLYSAVDLATFAHSVEEAVGFERFLDSVDLDTLSDEEADRLLARMQEEA